MRLKILSLAAGAMLLSAGAAAAAVVTGDLNLRSGPGTGYAVIDTMRAGARVDVLGCAGAWCRVNWRGVVGFASASYIAGNSAAYAPPAVYYAPGPYYYGPGPEFHFDFGFGGGWHHHRWH